MSRWSVAMLPDPPATVRDVLARHSECLTGDVFGLATL